MNVHSPDKPKHREAFQQMFAAASREFDVVLFWAGGPHLRVVRKYGAVAHALSTPELEHRQLWATRPGHLARFVKIGVGYTAPPLCRIELHS